MQDMMKMYAAGGMGGMDPNMFAADQTLTLNANNALVKYLFENKDGEHASMFAEQLYDTGHAFQPAIVCGCNE